MYIAEGCYLCHSQMIRTFTWESARYGAASTEDDSVWDHPFQWGSKRTGPDLAREGGKYPNIWHYEHMRDPRSTSPGSNMPSFAFLAHQKVDFHGTPDKMRALRTAGVPYGPAQIESAPRDDLHAGQAIARNLFQDGHVRVAPDSRLVALISYLQRLGHIPDAPASGARAAGDHGSPKNTKPTAEASR